MVNNNKERVFKMNVVGGDDPVGDLKNLVLSKC